MLSDNILCDEKIWMHYLLTPAFVIESSDDTYMFPCFAIFGLFGHMLSLTALDPKRHLLEAVGALLLEFVMFSICQLVVLFYIIFFAGIL